MLFPNKITKNELEMQFEKLEKLNQKNFRNDKLNESLNELEDQI
jgi:hypothetical protein